MRAQAYLYKLDGSSVKVTESVRSQVGMQGLFLSLKGPPRGPHGMISSVRATFVMVVGFKRSLRLWISIVSLVVCLLVRITMIRSLLVRFLLPAALQSALSHQLCSDCWPRIAQGAIVTTPTVLLEASFERIHAVVTLRGTEQASCARRLPICSLPEPLYGLKLQLLFAYLYSH